ncbi:MAG: signal recognition particle-docking protein FtsY [Deltaproteobacteria bacterium]|jgi:fused signal recognition particle receptor|nr:signal recognition particle-docking protein FtsY [Deltaproteobacteria bacterium]
MLDFFRKKKKDVQEKVLSPDSTDVETSWPQDGADIKESLDEAERALETQENQVNQPGGHSDGGTDEREATEEKKPEKEIEKPKKSWFGRFFGGGDQQSSQTSDIPEPQTEPALDETQSQGGSTESQIASEDFEAALDTEQDRLEAPSSIIEPNVVDQEAKITPALNDSLESSTSSNLPDSIKEAQDLIAQDVSEGFDQNLEGENESEEKKSKKSWFGRLFTQETKDLESPEVINDSPTLEEETEQSQLISASEPIEKTVEEVKTSAPEEIIEVKETKLGWFGRLKKSLASTRDMLAGRLEEVLSKVRAIDDEVLDELEEIMITSDLGIKTTNDIFYKIRGQVAKKELKDVAALKNAIKNRLVEMISLEPRHPKKAKPLVVMVIGVNGVGKTTTIAKLARIYQKEGQKVLLAAGDTFRAAAVEQLIIWAKRLNCDIVSQPTGADPSAVVFDAINAAKARKVDTIIIDTAGRLHTRVNLMEELKKIKRVAGKALEGAPHETILVLDANTGQNAVRQAEIFHESVGVDSMIVTKLDGTSKGGVVVSIIHEKGIPVSYIGIGERLEDLRPFEPEPFVEAIWEARVE